MVIPAHTRSGRAKRATASAAAPLSGASPRPRHPSHPVGGCVKPSTSAGTRVSGYILWGLTSDPSQHFTRHLLSYLDHQETTVLRPDFLVPGARNVPFGRRRGCRKPSKSPPQVSVGPYRVGFDIRSTETRLGTSFEPSTSPGDGGITSRLHLLPVRESVPRGARNRRNWPRTWVSGYAVQVLTSDPS